MAHGTGTAQPTRGLAAQSWIVVLVLFYLTSVVEAIGVSQIFAFMPIYLREMGLSESVIPQWVGVLNALAFVLGLPLVPLWGVWADKYSRKTIIIRSSLVEALVLGLVALSREPWQLAGSIMLAGFQLGNTGVMLAALRDLTPKMRLGTAIALFGASTPVGFAVGPALGSVMIDGLHTPIWAVFAMSAILSVAVAIMLALGFREVRPAVVPTGRVINLAYGAIRGVFTDITTRRLFLLFGITFLARQMSSPFLPIIVEGVHGSQVGLASAVALVVGTAALIGGIISPAAGAIGDKIGFRPVLIFSLVGAGLTLVLMPIAPNVPLLALVSVVFSALYASVSPMIFGLLAMEVPAERVSTTLNLVYLPLYISGIIGPAIASVVVVTGVPTAFLLSGLVFMVGALFVVTRLRRNT